MSENENLIDYYKNLLIIQYNDKPNAQAHIEALIRSAMIFDVAKEVERGFDIETAKGVQLDILGVYLGSDRIVTGVAFDRTYFGFVEYGATSPFDFAGYIKYSDEVPDVQFRSYKESKQSLFTLNDEEYRLILKLKIIQNNTIPSVKNIDEVMSIFFGDNVIFTDRQNMSISYIFNKGLARLITIAVSEGLLPRPSGVGLSVAYTRDITSIFAYSSYGGDAPTFAIGYSEYGDTEFEGGWSYYG